MIWEYKENNVPLSVLLVCLERQLMHALLTSGGSVQLSHIFICDIYFNEY